MVLNAPTCVDLTISVSLEIQNTKTTRSSIIQLGWERLERTFDTPCTKSSWFLAPTNFLQTISLSLWTQDGWVISTTCCLYKLNFWMKHFKFLYCVSNGPFFSRILVVLRYWYTDLTISRVYFRARLCGISTIRKKCRLKFTLAREMGRTKLTPKPEISEIKYSKTSLTIQDWWLQLYTLNFTASYCLNCLSLLRMFLCSYFLSSEFWVIFSHPCIYNDNNSKKKTEKVTVCRHRKPFFNEKNIRDSAVTRLQAFSVAPFLAPPFLKKDPLKIQREGPLGFHWPISTIKPTFHE